MRLLFLASDFPPAVGGIQTYVAELCAALVQAGAEPVILAAQHPDAATYDNGFPAEVIRVPPGSKSTVAQEMQRAGADLARSRDFDAIVATKWFLEGPPALALARQFRVPSVLMGYGNESALHGVNLVKAQLQRRVLTSADVALGISGYTVGEMIRSGTNPERTFVIGAGVRPEALACPPEEVLALRQKLGLVDEKALLTVGRVVARKGHQTLLRALRVIRAGVGQVRYVIVGRGPQEDFLRRMVEKRKLGELVTWAGAVPPERLAAYYHLSDLFVMCSKEVRGQPTEGLGLVYLEANACGKPVLGADTGGVSDAIAQDVNGLLIAPGDIPSCAAAAIKILGDPAYAARLGEAGRQRVQEQFLWRHVAERFMQAVVRV